MTEEVKKRGRKPKPKSDEPKVHKKRGRKPKPKQPEQPKVHKKRGRRRKCDITSDQQISGFNETGDTIDVVDDKLLFSGKDKISLEDKGGEKIAFGNFNICIKKVPASETSGLVQKLKHESNDKLCDINIPDNYSDSSEDEIDKTDNTRKHTAYFEAQKILNKKTVKKKNKNKGPIYSEEDNVNLSLVLEQFRGKYNEKVNWPKETDIHCWWCCHSFEGTPKTLPYFHDPVRNRYKIMGIFCSWSCSKAYGYGDGTTNSNFKNWNLTKFIRDIYGKNLKIKKAPPRQALKMFGGYMDIKQFRGNAFEEETIDIHKADCILDPSVYFIKGFNK